MVKVKETSAAHRPCDPALVAASDVGADQINLAWKQGSHSSAHAL